MSEGGSLTLISCPSAKRIVVRSPARTHGQGLRRHQGARRKPNVIDPKTTRRPGPPEAPIQRGGSIAASIMDVLVADQRRKLRPTFSPATDGGARPPGHAVGP